MKGPLSTGYGWVQMGMDDRLLGIPLWMILLLPFAKILATSLSIGSGGSGGIFGPGMVIGGMVGAAFWRLAYPILPGMPAEPAPFTIIAMMALFGGIAHAPLAVMLMVAEMTGNLSLLAPAMIAVGLSSVVCGDRTIYTSQLPTRADSPAHRYQFSFPLLTRLTVRESMDLAPLLLRPDLPVVEAKRWLVDRNLSGAPVVEEDGRLLGVATLTDIERAPQADGEPVPVYTVMTRDPVTIEPAAGLDLALEKLATYRKSWMPVVEGLESIVVGTISAANINRRYRLALKRSSRRMRDMTTGSDGLSERRPDQPASHS